MPLVPQLSPNANDTRELEAQPGALSMPPDTMSADPYGDGTGANGPKYSALDTWAAAARTTVPGRAESFISGLMDSGLMQAHPDETAMGRIPDQMLPFRDRYLGMYTQREVDFRTRQIQQEFEDARAMGEHKWATPLAFAWGLSDPVTLASMAVPLAGEARLGNAVRLALTGGGVAATDEALMRAMDPMHDFSIMNVAAGTLLSGLMGAAIKPHIPAADLAKLRARLQEDLSRPPPPTSPPPGAERPPDDAAAIARDLRAAVERHEALQAAQAAAAPKAPGEAPAPAAATPAAPEALPERPRTVRDQVLADLEQTGRFDKATNQAYAELIQAFADTQGKRLGMTGEAFFERYPLRVIEGGLPATAGVEERTLQPYTRDLFGNELEPLPRAERAPRPTALGPAITGPTNAIAAVRAVAGGHSGLVLLDATNTPVGFLPFGKMQLERLRGTGGMDALHRALSISNANVAIIANAGDLTLQQVRNIAGFMHTTGARVLDAINLRTGESLASTGEEDALRHTSFLQNLERGPPFYSGALHAVAELKLKSASAEQWEKTLANLKGVKAEELKWMGVPEFLKAHEGPVAKAELVRHMLENQVQVREVTLGGLEPGTESRREMIVDDIESLGFSVREDPHDGSPYVVQEDEHGTMREVMDGDLPDHVRDLLAELREGEGAEPHYHQFQLPGEKSNYRELLLTLPRQDIAQTFMGNHFGTPNVVAHARIAERIDAEGRKVLHIEEIQSDWHQAGRDRGYKTGAEDRFYNLKAEIEERYGKPLIELRREVGDARQEALHRALEIAEKEGYTVTDHAEAAAAQISPEARKLHDDLMRVDQAYDAAQHEKFGNQVPAAPFAKTWPELVLKRLVRYAADQGIDRITWTTGEQQAARYDLSKTVEKVRMSDVGQGEVHLTAYDKRGNVIINQRMPAGEVEQHVGKDVAKRLAEAPKKPARSIDSPPYAELAGLELKTGGEGMKGFYDRILPSIAKKLASKYGAEVGETKLETAPARPASPPLEPRELDELARLRTLQRAGDQSGEGPRLTMQGQTRLSNLSSRDIRSRLESVPAKLETVHTLELTPQMREGALAGQPLFQEQAKGAYTPETRTAALFEKADESTFLHESGHHFLDVTMEIAAHTEAPQELRDDAKTLLNWFGVEDLKSWRELGTEGQRAFHEQFARGFEAYLRDGRAPSGRLESLFERFRDWLVRLYNQTVASGRRVPDEIKAVMDRMVATREETAAARAAQAERATTPLGRRLATDDVLRGDLRTMAETESGWAQKGGRLLMDEEGKVLGRTTWIPNADWWPGRPGGYNAEEVTRLVDKALAGERLGPKQQQLVEYMTEVADQRRSSEPFLPKEEDFAGLDEHLKHEDPADAHEAAMVGRASAIDEAAVETLARMHEDDPAAFMAAIKRLLDAHDADASLARSGPAHRETPGPARDGLPVGAEHGPGAVTEPGERQGGGGSGFSLEGGKQPPAGRAGAAGGGRAAQSDLFGARPPGQAVADELARRQRAQAARGEVPLETGRPDDLFSQATRQTDLEDLLRRLPEAERAPFEERLRSLENQPAGPAPAGPSPPITAAPGESTAGARQTAQLTLKDISLARGQRVLGRMLGWFAPGSRLLFSPSVEVRRAAIELAETTEMLEMNIPSAEHPRGVPTPPSVELLLKKWEGAWMEGYRARENAFRDYNARELKPGEGPRLDLARFNEEVSAAMRRGDKHPVPEVAQAARDTRRLAFDPLKAEAQRLGLLPTTGDLLQGTAESYLMRQYDRAKIRAERVEWHTLLRDSFHNQGVDWAEADDIAHKVTRNMMGSELGLLDLNDTVFRDVVPQSGRLEKRQLLLPDTDLEKYLVNDIGRLSHAYVQSLAPQVEITKRFGDRSLTEVFQKVGDEYNVMTQRALAAGDNETANRLTDRLRSDIRDLGAIRDRLYGIYGVPGDPSSWIWRAMRVMRSVNVYRLLGTATLSHFPDAANVIMRHGFGNTFAAAAKLASSIEALKLNRDQLQAFGTAADMIHNTTAAQLGEFGAHSAYPVQTFLNRASRAFTIATLETPWIAFIKSIGGAIAQHEFVRSAERVAAGERLSDIEMTRLNQAGLGEDLLRRIGNETREHGVEVNGLRFGMPDAWKDTEAARSFVAAVDKHAEAATLSPSKGDTPLWTGTEWGKALFQFKTFGAVAVRKVVLPLAAGIAHGDLRAAQGLASLVASGALVYTTKQLVSGQPIEKDPKRFALEVLDKSNLLGWFGEYFYPMLWALGEPSFSRWGDRQSWETLFGPVFGAGIEAFDLRGLAHLRSAMASALGHPEYGGTAKPYTRADLHRWRRLLPANQIWYLRRAVNMLEQKVGDWMGLAPERPRESTE